MGRFVTGQWSVICAVSWPLLSIHTETGPSVLNALTQRTALPENWKYLTVSLIKYRFMAPWA
jgi:hypothetical protein